MVLFTTNSINNQPTTHTIFDAYSIREDVHITYVLPMHIMFDVWCNVKKIIDV